MQNQSNDTPVFTALRTNNTTIAIMLLDVHGAKEIKGLHVVSPSIDSPDAIEANTTVPTGKEIKITDPKLGGKVDLIVTTIVDGKKLTVINGTV